ncbi:MAG TPA: 5-formyltetrahydrofolate cyclo-ligase [Salinivirgaceae bacterium]|nr:5-formyltetrahydrofolate cyclo-ligase [Salinivirgaceae bacterium]HQA76584.1 5-formyltetrahydrofolate cyclo-ligase [Salinivirgaceae bacterium]
MTEIVEQKKSLRKAIRLATKELSIEQRLIQSNRVWSILSQYEKFVNAKTVVFYWSMETELNTTEFIESVKDTKKVLLPVVVGDSLILRSFEGRDKMVAEPVFGILEPVGDEFKDYNKIDFVIVPGMAFDKKGNRMGRGKGFYDRFLTQFPNAPKIGVCFSHQIVESVPSEPHDVKLDGVCSPEGLFN